MNRFKYSQDSIYFSRRDCKGMVTERNEKDFLVNQVFIKSFLFILAFSLILSNPVWGKKKKYLVAIDPGHGGLNLGSLDPRVKGNFEKTYTLIIFHAPWTRLCGFGANG